MTEIQVSLPIDSDGFLRRECPNCEREFKWLQTEGDGTPPPDHYVCPYCHVPGAIDAWWTKAQLEYATALAADRIVGPGLENMATSFNRQQRGGFVSMRMEVTRSPAPDALHEPDDMTRVDFPCHPSEPLKLDNSWREQVSCLVCGQLIEPPTRNIPE